MKKVMLIVGVLAVVLLLVPTNGINQQADEKVYWMLINEVSIANLEKYHTLMQEVIPLQEKHGYHFIAGWQTIVGNVEHLFHEGIRVSP